LPSPNVRLRRLLRTRLDCAKPRWRIRRELPTPNVRLRRLLRTRLDFQRMHARREKLPGASYATVW
jgi:hypothetical protein